MSDSKRNPWLSIPASDYDEHMSSPTVGQSQYLAEVFGTLLRAHAPQRLAVLGCATGNGFDAIPPETARVVGIDINPRYLARLERRFGQTLPGLELICADLGEADAALAGLDGVFDLVHAALVFEYVDPAVVLERVVAWLREGGLLSVVLQRPAAHAGRVTETPFTSLRALEPIMKLVEPAALEALADRAGLRCEAARVDTLPSGKPFYLGVFRRA